MSETDIQKMGTLLSRMTQESTEEVKFTDSQVRAVMEILIPRMATTMPGLPKGMTCSVEPDDDGWTIRVNKPKS